MLMHQLLYDGAARHPDKIAFRWVDRDTTLTFAEAVGRDGALRRRAASSRRAQGRPRHDLRPQRHGLSDRPVRLLADRRHRRAGQRALRRRARLLFRRSRAERRDLHPRHGRRRSGAPRARSPRIRALVCMDGPQPGAESLPALLDGGLRRRRPIPRDEDAIAHLSYTSGTTGQARRARAWRTSRPCGRRTASPSGCGSPATTSRSGRPRCRAPISSSATCCRRCIAAPPSTSWRGGRKDRAGMRWSERRRPSWSAIRPCSASC